MSDRRLAKWVSNKRGIEFRIYRGPNGTANFFSVPVHIDQKLFSGPFKFAGHLDRYKKVCRPFGPEQIKICGLI